LHGLFKWYHVGNFPAGWRKSIEGALLPHQAFWKSSSRAPLLSWTGSLPNVGMELSLASLLGALSLSSLESKALLLINNIKSAALSKNDMEMLPFDAFVETASPNVQEALLDANQMISDTTGLNSGDNVSVDYLNDTLLVTSQVDKEN